MYEEYLIHYGVKGMKWGVRKKRNSISGMSDAELQKKINRMNLENQYKNLTSKKKPKSNKGKKTLIGGIAVGVISPLLISNGKKIIAPLINTAGDIGAKAVQDAIDRSPFFGTGNQFVESMFRR